MTPLPQASRPFRGALVGSLLVHLGFLFVMGAGSRWGGRARPLPQHVLAARIVRLGTTRPEALLPHKAPEQPLPSRAPVAPPTALPVAPKVPPPTPKSVPAPSAPAPSLSSQPKVAEAPVSTRPPVDARDRIGELGKVTQALDRLRRQADGRADGEASGDTDSARAGDLFAGAVKACLERNYVIEGADPARVRGLTAQVVLRIQADGTIINFHLARASGVKAFDDAVARAVKRCRKTVAPPEAWRRVVSQEGIEIEFQP